MFDLLQGPPRRRSILPFWPMNCVELQAVLDRLLDGDLPAEHADACREHLATCDACARTVKQYQRLPELVRFAFEESGDDSLPEDLVQQLLRRLHREQRAGKPPLVS